MKVNLKIFLLSLIFIVVDLAVYIVLGLLMMRYDDFYDESEGEYWSLSSMTASEKLTYIGLQFWHIVNVALVIYIIYKLIKAKKQRFVI